MLRVKGADTVDGYPHADVFERPEFRNRVRVYRDRAHAGVVLAAMLGQFRGGGRLLLAVPAGGVPVAAVVAEALRLPLDVAVVSKITLPWNTEAGYGAVAWEGTVKINHGLAERVGLDDETIRLGVDETTLKVGRRVERFRGSRGRLEIEERQTVLIDDGLASGFTMLVAMSAIEAAGGLPPVVAIPTAPDDTVARIAERAEAVYCPNIREGRPFAVADAYEHWSDVPEETAAEMLSGVR
jgi:predicted phosphoribosyltransferase